MTPDEFGSWFPSGFFSWPSGVQFLTIILLTFVSEDLTSIGSALLAYTGALPWGIAWSGAFVGIWMGDALLYAFARVFGGRLRAAGWAKGMLDSPRVKDAEGWFKKRGMAVLWICRWIPGTRLPSYLAAGFVRLPFLPFLWVTGLMALLWTVLIFAMTSVVGGAIRTWLERFENGVLVILAISLVLLGVLKWLQGSRWWPSPEQLSVFSDRWLQWEFWPAWLFYLPVGIHYLVLACKYRGIALPTVSNPGIETGGMIGESKMALLESLMRVAPEHTADAYLIVGEGFEDRLEHLTQIMDEKGLQFPVIIKPDVGQRGSGVRKVEDAHAAAVCLRPDGFSLLVQEYSPGPCEAGVFYYRHPHEERGTIFAITHKVFPTVVGDGRQTLGELIEADPRARIMARIYRRRFHERLGDVLERGEEHRLVEAGNHAQGCIFMDGMFLNSKSLESKIDEISREVEGFFVGRYDIRYESASRLKQEAAFKIVELNGASAEATSIYDPNNSLTSAYRTLFRQWDIVFSIGAANRAQGVTPLSVWELWKIWRLYQVQSRGHLLAD